MAIEFSCSSCKKNYRVKDELAGKSADCTACGAKIRIPMLVSAASESDLNLNINQVSNLIDDELPTEQSATLTPAVTTSCEKCGEPIAVDAVLCVACGYDKRLGDVHETESEANIEAKEQATLADHVKRGGAFSFLGAMVGAAVCFALAATIGIGVKVGYPVLLVGILAGMGMRRYGGTDVGLLGGMVASIMALAGIFAAKALIYDQYRASPDALPDAIQLDSMFSLFQWYDILFVLGSMAVAFAFTQDSESTGEEMV